MASRSCSTLTRLSATLAFIAYILAGASFALPSEMRCARCAWTTAKQGIKPGMACPLMHNGQHCHHGPNPSAGKILLCPDGCLRHDGQGGEIPTPAKFLSAPLFPSPLWMFVGFVLEAQPLIFLAPFIALPDHPPSVRS